MATRTPMPMMASAMRAVLLLRGALARLLLLLLLLLLLAPAAGGDDDGGGCGGAAARGCAAVEALRPPWPADLAPCGRWALSAELLVGQGACAAMEAAPSAHTPAGGAQLAQPAFLAKNNVMRIAKGVLRTTLNTTVDEAYEESCRRCERIATRIAAHPRYSLCRS